MTHLRQRLIGSSPGILKALALIVPAIALYLLTAPWPDTPDGLFHLHRVRALAEALRMGVLYPRWFPDFAFGYGYPVLNFYAPAFYTPPALLHLAGLDLIVAVRVTLAAWYALSGLAAYVLLRCWARPLPAALGALLYLVYPYRLYDLFVRGALPEFAAFFWLPLIVWATIRWLAPAPNEDPSTKSHEGTRSSRRGPACPSPERPSRVISRGDCVLVARLMWAVVAALSWAGLILTHNLTALMAALAGLGVAVLWTVVTLLRRGHDDRSCPLLTAIWGLGLPLALGAALSAPYILPALLETGWIGIGATAEAQGYAVHFATLGELFDFSLLYRYPDAAQPTVPAPGYAAALLVAAVAVLLLPRARGRRVALAFSAGSGFTALWLGTASSAFVWDGLAPLLGKLQFPWRWQIIAALALAGALARVLDISGRWLAPRSRTAYARPLTWGFVLALTAYLALHAFGGLRPSPAAFSVADLTAAQMWAFDAQHGQVGASWTGEFLPRWVTEQRWAIGREPSRQADAAAGQALPVIQSARVLVQDYLGERLRYEASGPGQLVFHAFYYPAWRIEVDGLEVPAHAVGDLGLLAADLPAGQHEVARRWNATPAVWAGRAVAAVGWLAVLGLLILVQDRRRPLFIGLWLLAVALVIIGGSGWLVREQPAMPVGADYKLVRLESALAPPARPGETATITLHWLVTARPEPLTAYVHVVAADGRMVAGHDAPLGGLYTPASRWWIGELLPDRHVLPLPADLPPGVYQLKAGLYRPAAPDAPLMPAGAGPADPSVDVGVLEVRP